MKHLHYNFLLPSGIVLGLYKHMKGISKVVLSGKLTSRIMFGIIIRLPTKLCSGDVEVHHSANSADEIFARNVNRNVDVLGRLVVHRDANNDMLCQSCQCYQT